MAPADPAEQMVHQKIDQPGIEDEEEIALHGLKPEDVDVGGKGDLLDEFAELVHFGGNGNEFGGFAEKGGEGDLKEPGEPFVDDLESRHAPSDDPFLAREIVLPGPLLGGEVERGLGRGVDLPLGQAAKERVDLLLRQDFIRHRYVSVARITSKGPPLSKNSLQGMASTIGMKARSVNGK
jgi:hypothetical protein